MSSFSTTRWEALVIMGNYCWERCWVACHGAGLEPVGSLEMLGVFDLEVNSFGWCFRKISLTTAMKAEGSLASQ